MLRRKYLKDSNFANYGNLPMNNCSSTWRGVSFGAKLILKGLKWRVGDGSKIQFWYDARVPEFYSFKNQAISPLSADQLLEKVSDYTYGEEWNIHKLNSVLPWDTVLRIYQHSYWKNEEWA